MSQNKNNKTVWSTRITKDTSSIFQKVGSSLSIDKRLFKEDIAGSIAHVEMLFKQKIITFKIKNKIIWGLNKIRNEIIKKKFKDLNFFLLYGENEGLKKDCIKEICTIKNIKTLTTKYDEIEIINNPENFHNLIFSGSLFERDKIIIINQASDKLNNIIQNSINKKIQNITDKQILELEKKLTEKEKEIMTV